MIFTRSIHHLAVGFVIAISILFSGQSHAQDEEHVKNMMTSFDQYKKATVDKDFEKLSTFHHPTIVEMGGGQTYLIDDLKRDVGMYEAIGISITDIIAKQPSAIIQAGDELHAMLPIVRKMKTKVDNQEEANYLLAVSQDNGESWYFIDMRKQDAESIKVFLPNYDDRLSVYLK